jgi:hypothetical protein
MTMDEAIQNKIILQNLLRSHAPDKQTWLLLIEHQLRNFLADESPLMNRFGELRDAILHPPSQTEQSPGRYDDNAEKTLSQFIDGVITLTNPQQSDTITAIRAEEDRYRQEEASLQARVDRVIQAGYFRSIYFRSIVGGLSLVLILITGVGSFKIYEQTQAMQRLLDDARNRVEQSNQEVAKARAETNNKQAELALLILQGNQNLVTMRTAAIEQVSSAQDLFRTEMNTRTGRIFGELDHSASDASASIEKARLEALKTVNDKSNNSVAQIDADATKNRSVINNAIKKRLQDLEQAKNPYVPVVIWSMAKVPLVMLFAAALSIFALVNSISKLLSFPSRLRWSIAGFELIVAGLVIAFLIRMP